MNINEKLHILTESSKYDVCASTASKRKITQSNNRIGNAVPSGICHSFTPDGRCIALYKILLSNACVFDCKYCMNNACTKKTVATINPEELCGVFMNLYLRNYVEGLFLSSGIEKNSDYTGEKMLDVLRLLRTKFQFHGYIHIKVLPGINRDLLKALSSYADRVSLNVETPNKSRMSEVSSTKDYKIDILRRQSWIKKLNIPSGQTTQFIIGSAGESDLEILKMMNWEYESIGLRRSYFSAFDPVDGTALSKQMQTPHSREVSLYNVDWLLRVYNYKFTDIRNILNDSGNLPKEDPKVVIARQYFDSPLDINDASFDDLIRVPGIGHTSAQRILEKRSNGMEFTKYRDLQNLGVITKRAIPFLKVNGNVQTSLEVFT